MSNIRVKFDGFPDRSHDIIFDETAHLPQHMADSGLSIGRCVLVTDANVGHLYGDSIERSLIDAGWRCRVVTLPPGEPTKSPAHLSEIIDAALSFGIDRGSPLIALGGGVIGDVSGLAAALLLRGIPFVQIPTSLIGQVDSAIGGKTGINHATGKNLVGAFHQPSLILTDTRKLSSLPLSEWMAGLSEVVKAALVRDADLFRLLLDRWDAILDRDPVTVSDIVRRCAEIKVAIVQADERESGRRAILNFGHTFGHALEKVAGYAGVTHGVAVAAGMRAALYLSGLRHPEQDFSEALELVDRLPRPSETAAIGAVAADTAHESEIGAAAGGAAAENAPAVDIDALVQAMLMDKKRVGDRLRFVLLDRVGSAVLVDDVTDREIRDGWEFSLGPFK